MRNIAILGVFHPTSYEKDIVENELREFLIKKGFDLRKWLDVRPPERNKSIHAAQQNEVCRWHHDCQKDNKYMICWSTNAPTKVRRKADHYIYKSLKNFQVVLINNLTVQYKMPRFKGDRWFAVIRFNWNHTAEKYLNM